MINTPGYERALMLDPPPYTVDEKVRDLQKLINFYFSESFGKMEEDGKFGPGTETAVEAVQAIIGVEPDGIWYRLSAAAFDNWVKRLTAAVAAGITSKVAVELNKLTFSQALDLHTARETLQAALLNVQSVYAQLGVTDKPEAGGVLDEVTAALEAVNRIDITRGEIYALTKKTTV